MEPIKTYTEPQQFNYMPSTSTPSIANDGSAISPSDANVQSIFGIDDAIVGAIVAGIATVASTVISNKKADKRQKASQEWQEEQTKKLQEYNSPEQQRARLMQAGINPLQGVENSASQMVANPGTAETKAPDWSYAIGALSAIGQNKVANAQAENLKSNTELNNIDAETRREKNANEILLQSETIDEIKSRINVNEETAAKIVQDMQNSVKQLEINDYLAQLQGKEFDLNKQRYELDKAIREAELDNQGKYLALEQAKYQLEAMRNSSQLALNSLEAMRINKAIQMLDKQAELVAKDVDWYESSKVVKNVTDVLNGASGAFRDIAIGIGALKGGLLSGSKTPPATPSVPSGNYVPSSTPISIGSTKWTTNVNY